jgi:hypothetical protein
VGPRAQVRDQGRYKLHPVSRRRAVLIAGDATVRQPGLPCRAGGRTRDPLARDRMRSPPSMSSSKPGASNTTRRSNASSRIAMRYWPSTTSRPSTGSICARPTSPKARSRPCVTAPCAPRDVFRIRPRSHDLQARRGREKLASPRWSQSVAESHPRCKVHRWNRGCQIASGERGNGWAPKIPRAGLARWRSGSRHFSGKARCRHRA